MDMTDFVDKGKLLRVAECSVENVKRDRFEQVLKDAGNRAMTPGCCQAHSVKGKTADIWPPHYGTMKIRINGMRIGNCLH
jgi:hypothetical protein